MITDKGDHIMIRVYWDLKFLFLEIHNFCMNSYNSTLQDIK